MQTVTDTTTRSWLSWSVWTDWRALKFELVHDRAFSGAALYHTCASWASTITWPYPCFTQEVFCLCPVNKMTYLGPNAMLLMFYHARLLGDQCVLEITNDVSIFLFVVIFFLNLLSSKLKKLFLAALLPQGVTTAVQVWCGRGLQWRPFLKQLELNQWPFISQVNVLTTKTPKVNS